ncbi:hypothetical protein N0V84_002187 [Fusarium piperis]|uniref:Aminotransferase class I/classII large domain-containing protein n=1 Tax=Fusarium piperis TaxID=1435070 RepID=A0A9W8WJS8_9HYPO|nr:hypothetical protein N0V84_002187 [Fusarium piperis]
MFKSFQRGPVDQMFILKKKADSDVSPEKADLGVGIYRNETGLYNELSSVKQAKLALAQNDPGHDYELTTGNAQFLEKAASVVFGKECKKLKSGQIASVQAISGTGAIHIAVLALSKCISPLPQVFVGVPTWGNYKPMFELVGMQVSEYSYYDPKNRTIDFSSIIQAARTAPPRSVFILQACCQNPTGADPTKAQWDELASVLEENGHFIFLDIAYQGLGDGMDEDAYAVRLFAKSNVDMFVCQSFSKNFALYGERCGVLHAVCADAKTASDVHDRLRCLIRWEFSSSPAYGSRLVNIVLGSDKLTGEWQTELSGMRRRLESLRNQLHSYLTKDLKTPGSWEHILKETGLFSYLSLSPAQCNTLIDRHHIYLPSSGRINISGLNKENIERVAKAIDQVVRGDIKANL